MNSKKESDTAGTPPPVNCPHCGVRLSRWERVLLNVDRVLLCKNCWYRIILDVFDEGERKSD